MKILSDGDYVAIVADDFVDLQQSQVIKWIPINSTSGTVLTRHVDPDLDFAGLGQWREPMEINRDAALSAAFDEWWEDVDLPSPHVVYLMRDIRDHLLYVGITINLRDRMKSHYDSKPWIGEVDSISVESHPTREAAKARETQLILHNGPVFNIAENQRLENVVSYYTDYIVEKCPQLAEDVSRAVQGAKAVFNPGH